MKINTNNKSLKFFIKQIVEKIKDYQKLKEIKKRIKTDSLLIDVKQEDLEPWKKRIKDVKDSPDNAKISCVEEAGSINNKGYLVMHNGLIIKPLSYYGYPVLKMLLENKGIHEPQEEFAFQEVLKNIPKNATMIELGAYWSFYSMWFNKVIPGAKNFMIEPWEIHHGIRNFKLNKLEGNFYQYYISDKPGIHHDGSKIISVDSFVNENKISFVDILHSDIQGNEYKMLQGSHELLKNKKVGYIFISTHSNELHENCSNFLEQMGYHIVCSANMEETCSYDGLLVFKNPNYPGIDKIEISHRKH